MISLMGEVKILNQDHADDTDSLVNMMGTKDYDRFLKIQDPAIPSTERLSLMWKMTSNQIVRLRREARREIRYLNSLYSEKSQMEKQLKADRTKAFINKFKIECLESYIRCINVSVNSGCICMNRLNGIKNTHSNNRNIDLTVTTKKDDEGIILFENNIALACFDTKYCPMCGKKLSGGDNH